MIAGPRVPDNVYLADSQIGGDLTVGGVAAELNLAGIRVNGALHMTEDGSSFGKIMLTGAEVGHDWLLQTTKNVQSIEAENLHVKQSATVSGNIQSLNLQGAKIDGELKIDPPQVSGSDKFANFSANLRNTRVGSGSTIDCGWTPCTLNLSMLGVDEDLVVKGKSLYCLNLSQAKIGGQLDVDDLSWPRKWEPPDCRGENRLSLRNAQVGSAKGALSAWPDQAIDLRGFTYGHVPEITRADGGNARLDWLDRDPKHEPEAYAQLASMLAAQGEQDEAADVQYAARNHDLSSAWENSHYGPAALLFTMKWLGSYGIGTKAWYCLIPIAAFTAASAVVIRTLPGAREKGWGWILAAGLHNLLPYHPLDHSIADFLEEQRGFHFWQKLTLFALWLVGVFLALFLAAAATGFTQRG